MLYLCEVSVSLCLVMEKCGIKSRPARTPLPGSVLKFSHLNGFYNAKGEERVGPLKKSLSDDSSSNCSLIKTLIHGAQAFMRKDGGELLELVCRACDRTDTQGWSRCVTQSFWTLQCGSVKEGEQGFLGL